MPAVLSTLSNGACAMARSVFVLTVNTVSVSIVLVRDGAITVLRVPAVALYRLAGAILKAVLRIVAYIVIGAYLIVDGIFGVLGGFIFDAKTRSFCRVAAYRTSMFWLSLLIGMRKVLRLDSALYYISKEAMWDLVEQFQIEKEGFNEEIKKTADMWQRGTAVFHRTPLERAWDNWHYEWRYKYYPILVGPARLPLEKLDCRSGGMVPHYGRLPNCMAYRGPRATKGLPVRIQWFNDIREVFPRTRASPEMYVEAVTDAGGNLRIDWIREEFGMENMQFVDWRRLTTLEPRDPNWLSAMAVKNLATQFQDENGINVYLLRVIEKPSPFMRYIREQRVEHQKRWFMRAHNWLRERRVDCLWAYFTFKALVQSKVGFSISRSPLAVHLAALFILALMAFSTYLGCRWLCGLWFVSIIIDIQGHINSSMRNVVTNLVSYR